MAENIKLVEQERDALRMIAKNEEIARIAAEGRIPLPVAKEDDEFASPKKERKSLDPVLVTSSAAAEEDHMVTFETRPGATYHLVEANQPATQ